MAGEAGGLSLRAGRIVRADRRGDARTEGPGGLRVAGVVEDDGLFAPGCPNVILGPLTDDAALVIEELLVAITPTPENGCARPCRAASHLEASTSKRRVTATASRVTAGELAGMRR